jgi:hypothetical protein
MARYIILGMLSGARFWQQASSALARMCQPRVARKGE